MSHKDFTAGTLSGLAAIFLWATLALLTVGSGGLPPFQKTAFAFTLAAAISAVRWLLRPARFFSLFEIPVGAWALGVGGLFGYHFFYFLALARAPAVQASLVAYLWPLLIVLLSAALTGARVRWWQILGACLGLTGTFLLVTGGKGLSLNPAYLPGYLSAGVCALVWSSYSVLNRRYREVPTDAVGGFCAVTAVLAWIAHFLLETTIWPAGSEWVALLVLGAGPMGIAFFLWDYGVKHGNIVALGTLSYLAPLLSTILLVLFAKTSLTFEIALSCFLIVGGSVLGSLSPATRR